MRAEAGDQRFHAGVVGACRAAGTGGLLQAAHEQAWVTTTRVLKGIPGETYMKDIVYLEGNVRCWMNAAENPERILDGDLGKFDISRQDHLEILKSLNIDVL